MTRWHIAGLLGLLSVAFSTGIATAQTQPEASATASPSPNMRGPEYFAAGDYLWDTNSRSQFNTFGTGGHNSVAGRAAVEYPFGKIAVMAEGTYDSFQYDSTTVPSFYAHNIDWDGRLGVGLRYPRIFLVASYGQRSNDYHDPNLQGYGFGIEKLPDFNEKLFSVFGSYLYYPQFGSGNALQYGFYKYQAGVEFHPHPGSHFPGFLELGYMGDQAYAKKNAPTFVSDQGLFAGVGVHF
jgi:hypothetical protein